MIARYTRPEMGRIWSDENKFQQWLEVELAAAEALAELGVVPGGGGAPAARARRFRRRPHPRNRARSEARRHRLHHRGGGEHGRGRARRGLALAALRADVERRGGYRAGAADRAGVGASSCAGLEALRAVLQAARARIPAHRADRPHPRRACRADHLRPETGHLVRRSRAQPASACGPPPRRCGSARSRARWAPSRTSARRSRSASARGWA